MDSEMSRRDDARVAVTLTRFPRGRLFWRLYYSTETTLGRLPVVILIPTASAIVGTAWGASHPSETISKGLVVSQASFGSLLLTSLVGAVIALLALIGLVFVATIVLYRLLNGDAIWEAVYSPSTEGISVQLRCKEGVTADPVRLERIECLLEKPSGEIVENDGPLTCRHSPQGWVADFHLEPEPGRYKVRWSAQREGQRWREIARTTFQIEAPTRRVPPPAPGSRPWKAETGS
jgi:hypothetical protein